MGRAFEYRRASKEARWDKMSKLYPKLGKIITMAAKEGGSDPESNAKLRAAIINAKSQNMPKDNIDKAIKRADGKDFTNYDEVNYEVKGPHGVLLFVECATDNNTRTFSQVRTAVNKNGGELLNSGALNFMFNRKAVVVLAKSEDMDLEMIELELIDAGLEELETDGENVVAYADYIDFGNLSAAIEKLGLEIKKAELQRIPSNPVEFAEEHIEEIENLIDKLEDDEDVQKVFSNIS
ncbi:YebC/PmpR family DNA-binding transcriptional regulator [Akkermansiaceae bacterium]|nr:YebC/PmpR family DNA-binding transcriptional regulator [Akkermansiaceae bacterium]